MKMPSVMGHKFSEVPRAEIQRSQFDRSFGYKTTFDAGWLIPFYLDEALPGDTFQLRTAAFARLATPLHPLMDNMYIETFFFSVPNRLLWTNWQKFNGEQDDPGDSTDFVIPQIGATGIGVGGLSDYFGLPTGTAGPITFSALPFRAYALIWNEWFRDQNLQDSLVISKGDGPDTGYGGLQRRGKRHDYFTSCLPWPQKGDSVSLPLGSAAPVVPNTIGASSPSFWNAGATAINKRLMAGENAAQSVVDAGLGTGTWALNEQMYWQTTELYADLTNATAATINELRQAFQIQKLLERDARGGTRYTEILKSHFGVTSPDARLQRPEYLGGGSAPVNISPVAQTSAQAAGSTPLAELAAIGTASFRGHGFVKSFTEHCTLIGLVCVRADLTYQQGMERMWSRTTRYDFYWPALSHIGEQAVLRKELYATGTALDDDMVFGYQERYAEYRYKPSKITGLFRTAAAGTLDSWHLSQELGFGGGSAVVPTLSAAFIVEDPPIDRTIAVPTEPHFLFDSFTSLKCARPMPVYGVPGLIDHF